VIPSGMAPGWERGWIPPAHASTVGLQRRSSSGAFACGSRVGGTWVGSDLPRSLRHWQENRPCLQTEPISSGVSAAVAQGALRGWGLQRRDSLLAAQHLRGVRDVPVAGPLLRQSPPAQELSGEPPARLGQPAAGQPRQLRGAAEDLPAALSLCRF